jgi:DNA polymerase-3 subunit epsilon
MKVHNKDYPDYKTARQWANQVFLPVEGVSGIELWANRNYQDKYIYYSPEEVRPATAEQLATFFTPERERRNHKARERRQRKKKLLEQEKIQALVQPYQEKIAELEETIRKLKTIAKINKTIVIDAETTGLNTTTDEVLQLSIIDGYGNTLFNEFFKPQWHEECEEAEDVNGISPEMVADKPSIETMRDEIEKIITSADVIVGYNIHFNLDMINIPVREDTQIVDVMVEFAEVYGEWNDYYKDYKWQKLTKCADYYGYDWGTDAAHDSLADCRATLYII